MSDKSMDDKILEFRKKFKTICNYKSCITGVTQRLKLFYRFDKDGSHKKIIDKTAAQRKEFVDKFNELLNGKTYDEWRTESKQISLELSKIKQSGDSIERSKKKIEDILRSNGIS